MKGSNRDLSTPVRGSSNESSSSKTVEPKQPLHVRFRGNHNLSPWESTANRGSSGGKLSISRIQIRQRYQLKKLLSFSSGLHPLYNHHLLSKICVFLRTEEIITMMSVCSCWHSLPLRDDALLWETLATEGEIPERFRQILWILMANSERSANNPSANSFSRQNGNSHRQYIPSLMNNSFVYDDGPILRTINVKSRYGGALTTRQVRVRWRKIPSVHYIREELQKEKSEDSRRCLYEKCLICAQTQSRVEFLREEIENAERTLAELEQEEAAVLHSILGHSHMAAKNNKGSPSGATNAASRNGTAMMLFASSSRVYGGGVGRANGSTENEMVAAAQAAVSASATSTNSQRAQKGTPADDRNNKYSKFRNALRNVSLKLKKKKLLKDSKFNDDDDDEQLSTLYPSQNKGNGDLNNNGTKSKYNINAPTQKSKDILGHGYTLSPGATDRWHKLQERIENVKDTIETHKSDLEASMATSECYLKSAADTVAELYQSQWNTELKSERPLMIPSWVKGCIGICIPLPPWLFEHISACISAGSDISMHTDHLREHIQDFVRNRCFPHTQITTDVDRTFGDLAESAINEIESQTVHKDANTTVKLDSSYDIETLMDSVCSSRQSNEASSAQLKTNSRPLESGSAPAVIRLRRSLSNVLLAYAVWDPSISYCQGMNYVVAMLLRVFEGDETLAFHTLAWLMHSPDYNLQSLFSSDLQGLEEHFEIHKHLRKTRLPHLHEHFERHEITPDMYGASRWFMTQFSSLATFPMSIATQIWDWWILAGWRATHSIALAVLSEATAELLSRDFMNCIQFLSTMLPVAILQSVNSSEVSFETMRGHLALKQPLSLWKRAFRRIRHRAVSYDISYCKVRALQQRIHQLLIDSKNEEAAAQDALHPHRDKSDSHSSGDSQKQQETASSSRPFPMLYTPRSWRKRSEKQIEGPTSEDKSENAVVEDDVKNEAAQDE